MDVIRIFFTIAPVCILAYLLYQLFRVKGLDEYLESEAFKEYVEVIQVCVSMILFEHNMEISEYELEYLSYINEYEKKYNPIERRYLKLLGKRPDTIFEFMYKKKELREGGKQ